LSLNGKRILFFSPKFLGYDEVIKNELERRGAGVSLYDERPSSNSVVKALIRVNPKLLESFSRKYFSDIFAKENNKFFDYIFIIKGEAISPQVIGLMKKYFKKSKLIFYSWDSLKNVKYTDTKIHLFDKAFSFDRDDCEKYQNVNYLPLFFSPSYSSPEDSHHPKSIDLIFIASLHSDRYKVLKRILANVAFIKPDFSAYSFLFYSSKLFFLLRKLLDRNFLNVPYSQVKWTPLSQDDVVRKIHDANIIIDINHPKQSGLTMRTIESVALKKKLITTNASIRHERFYDEANILIIDRNKPAITKDFIFSPYKEIDKIIISEYSVETWVSNIFCE
jgi:hypothetical protein